MQYMRSAIGGTPDANARGVDFWSEGDPGDGIAIVLVLFGGNNMSPGLSLISSLEAIIEDQSDKTCIDKSFIERIKIHLFNSTKTPSHDHNTPLSACFQIIWEIEPTD